MSDERPPPDLSSLLEDWMKWERGEIEPGRLLANLKKGGMREVLEDLAAATAASGGETS